MFINTFDESNILKSSNIIHLNPRTIDSPRVTIIALGL